MTILMEISSHNNIDTVEEVNMEDKDSHHSPKKERVRKSSLSKAVKKAEILHEKFEEKRMNGKRQSKKLKKERDKKPKQNGDVEEKSKKEQGTGDRWHFRVVGGTDLTSRPAVVSVSGTYVFLNSRNKVLVYSSKSGQLVRQLNTGAILAIQRTENEEEIVVASAKKLAVWNFVQVKIVEKFKIHRKHIANFEKLLQGIYIPEQFHKDQEIFITTKEKSGDKIALYRVNLRDKSTHKIFNNAKPESVHVGDYDNIVCAISDHKVHGFKDASLLVYDKNLAKNISLHTDKERPYTVARVHPTSKVIAAGDTSGRILVYSAFDQPESSKSILHWHSLPLTSLSWSSEGSVLYSGGGEGVLCKWRQEEGSRPSFVPRLGGGVVGLVSGASVTVVQLENNVVKILDTLSDNVTGTVSGLARHQGGYPAGLVADRDRLVLNGGVGMVQVYRVTTDTVHSVDITQQNMITRERSVVPHNSEVERVAVSGDGHYMATVDCLWADLNRILLKLWTWREELTNYSLNTQVEFPHYSGVKAMVFQPVASGQGTAPMLLTIGCDNRAKLWQLSQAGNSWSCSSCLSFRQLSAECGGWSGDGTIIGVGFGYLVTLWSSRDSSLVTSLSLDNCSAPVTSLMFGHGPASRSLFTANSSSLVSWDLITLTPSWSLALDPSPHTVLTLSSSAATLAVVQKDNVIMVTFASQAVKTLENMNCTGGAVWIGEHLYYLEYSGRLMRLSREKAEVVRNTAIMTSSSNVSSWLVTPQSSKTNDNISVQPMTKARTMHDIDSLLALPLHTVPAPHQLSHTLVRNRLLALPRQRRKVLKKMEDPEEGVKNDQDAKTRQKIDDVFKFEVPEPESLDLKSFCKLLKKSCL